MKKKIQKRIKKIPKTNLLKMAISLSQTYRSLQKGSMVCFSSVPKPPMVAVLSYGFITAHGVECKRKGGSLGAKARKC